MKKILCVLMLCILFNLQAKAEEKSSTLSARGTASGEVKADTATVSIAVETEAKKIGDAIIENNTASEKINSNIKKLLGCDDRIKTKGFQVTPVYIYDKQSTPPNRISGYRVSNQIEVKTKDITKLGKIIETALNSGANSISGLEYGVSDTKKICGQLIDEAAKNAKNDAEILAKSLNLKITGVNKVSYSCNNNNQPRPYFMKAAFAESDAGVGAPALEAGDSTINAEVYVDFVVE